MPNPAGIALAEDYRLRQCSRKVFIKNPDKHQQSRSLCRQLGTNPYQMSKFFSYCANFNELIFIVNKFSNSITWFFKIYWYNKWVVKGGQILCKQ